MQRNKTIDPNHLSFDSQDEFYEALASHYQEATLNQVVNETEITKKDKKKPSIKQKIKNKLSAKDKAKSDQQVATDKIEVIDNTNMHEHAFPLYKLISGFDLTNIAGEYLTEMQKIAKQNDVQLFESLLEFITSTSQLNESESDSSKHVSCDGRILINLNLIDIERDIIFNDADLNKINTKEISLQLQANPVFIDLCTNLNLLTSHLTKQDKNKIIDNISAKALLIDLDSNKYGHTSTWDTFWKTLQLDNDAAGHNKSKLKEFVMDALIFVVSQQIGTMMHLQNANQQHTNRQITKSKSVNESKKSLPSSSSGFFNRNNIVEQKDTKETKDTKNISHSIN